MLNAMLTSLIELEAGEGPQGMMDEKESADVMSNAEKAIEWIVEELARRERQKSRKKSQPVRSNHVSEEVTTDQDVPA